MNSGKEYRHDNARIAYFSMEVGISHTIPTYSGGLGILAGDTLKSFADTELPAVGVTLLNEKGYFHQTISDDGWQQEAPVEWNPNDRLTPLPNVVTVIIAGREVTLRAWKLMIHGLNGNKMPLYYLDANVEGNAEEDRRLTSYLYGGDRKYRLSQEIILGVGGTKMLASLGYHNLKKYHMNEGHAALLTVELMKQCQDDGHSEEEHVKHVRKKCVFTTHTPVAAGHDRFDKGLFHELLGEYVPGYILEHITEGDKVNMTLLGLYLSGHVNGVAKRHGEVTKEMFPNYQDSIDYITNGIHPITWASPEMKAVFDRHIPGWKADAYTLRNALSIPGKEIWGAHESAKKRLVEEVNDRTGAGFDHRRFTIGFARRFTAYKRPDLILQDIEMLKSVTRAVGDIQVVFAGKAHKQDVQGKEIIKHIWQTCKQVNAEGGNLRMVFLEHYDISLSQMMVAGCDVWLNNPQRPFEASGTSGMKAALNGTPQISTVDGWWVEGHIEGVTGWKLGPSPLDPGYDNDYSPDDEANDLYNKLKYTIVPLYYGKQDEWIRIMKHCIAINASFFNTYRMAQQYMATTYRE
ncbi:alpha-glucan family phosphorylase [Candidatus Woesearchaeota archaeon]|nr:alpha-glucan family phosphorylase [Candidatus Woesearchaeota archaeon]